jgi:effector-binding domain-containing protein
MPLKPILVERVAQPYIAIRANIQREALGDTVPGLFAKVVEWLTSNQIIASGAPIIRYLGIDYNSEKVDIHVGFPISTSKIPSNALFLMDKMPGGSYATVLHCGAYANLVDSTALLLAWGKENHIKWQFSEKDRVTEWRGRAEHYLVGPPAETNPENWRTEIAVLKF